MVQFSGARSYAWQAGLQVDRLDERGICAHSTRVTAITASFEGGAKLEEIQQLVGHKDPEEYTTVQEIKPEGCGECGDEDHLLENQRAART
jgi:Phage integrase family.